MSGVEPAVRNACVAGESRYEEVTLLLQPSDNQLMSGLSAWLWCQEMQEVCRVVTVCTTYLMLNTECLESGNCVYHMFNVKHGMFNDR
jgi:hypothetical protein